MQFIALWLRENSAAISEPQVSHYEQKDPLLRFSIGDIRENFLLEMIFHLFILISIEKNIFVNEYSDGKMQWTIFTP